MDDKDSYKYAWDWFQHHAVQRYSSFYYCLLTIGALAYGYVYSNSSKEKLVIALFGVIVSLAFLFIEKRNADLVECARMALDDLENNKKCVLSKSYIRYRDKESSKNKLLTHRFWFRFVISFLFIISLIAFAEIIITKWDKVIIYMTNCTNYYVFVVAIISVFIAYYISSEGLDRVKNIKTTKDS